MKPKTMALLLLTALLATWTVGCSTMEDAREAKGTGRAQTYDAPFDTVWENAKIAIGDVGLLVGSENEEEGYILAQKGMSAFSYGENVAVFVDKLDDTHTKVEVVSKKAMATNVFAANWEKPILERLTELLAKSGD